MSEKRVYFNKALTIYTIYRREHYRYPNKISKFAVGLVRSISAVFLEKHETLCLSCSL